MEVLSVAKPTWMSEDLVMLEEQAKRFVDTQMVPHVEKWTEDGIMDRSAWNKLGEAGLLLAGIPEEYGGAGGTFAHETVINRTFGLAGLDSLGAGLHSGIVAPYILRYGTEEQKKRWLPKLATGEMVGAIAMSEPGTGSDLQNVKSSAKKSGNGYILNGSKTFITNGQLANLIIVVAKTDPNAGHKGISLMVVETDDAQGFRRGRKLKKMGLDWADTSELFFDDVKLPAESLLGTEEGMGFIQLMSDLPQERLIVTTGAVAAMERALAMTIAYVKERKAFGKHIAEFQNTQFELAECKTEATIARVFHDNCVERHLKGELDTVTASMAKYWTTDLQNKIIDRCLQLFGGYGFMDEYPISRMYRDARVQRIYAGTNEIMKVVIARSL
ncbi:acyl-CoA dehydrogenase [Variibacter gotjawalensis]|uniref:Acyl-CoA dehydrogenase n=1 Tax=Variibacter gotjawalensis TaxID=1333996 RepID=A0A0S3PVF8_9BRAD|nr:acyl-CoA dehydrogenase family protein [Variibacter gotjawalensis]NIK45750.1 acyl-CoA dehydrogenase [Variibacter gotjawalensis]RZS47674.1 acyl-CoA dehydrogenase [Variibacter gotjawalensis]BAT59927.1 acyl-CoA dehydrogenase [Variibacter gotjawalensis]